MSDALWVNIPAAAAVITVVGMFLRYMAADRAKDREMWANHLSNTAAALQRITTLLEVLVDRK